MNLLENLGRPGEQISESDLANIEPKARCPDLFSLMARNRKYEQDGSIWPWFIPVIDVGIVNIDVMFKPESGLHYHPDWQTNCDGSTGTEGSTCLLVCPGETDEAGDFKKPTGGFCEIVKQQFLDLSQKLPKR